MLRNMKALQLASIFVSLLLLATIVEGKRRKQNNLSSPSTKSKTKTKWSSTSDVGVNGPNTMVASEEHGYYVRRTFQPASTSPEGSVKLQSPPFLAIPVAWFDCKGTACMAFNSVAVNSNANAIKEGFLCDDDCTGPYQPTCGRTTNEVAIFYNKCKLDVAKCRTHGFWHDLPYEECKSTYPAGLAYADKKFRASPYFKETSPGKIEEDAGSDTATTEKTPESNVQQLLIKDIDNPTEKNYHSEDLYEVQ